jgi:hypothetical protein
MKLQDDGKYLQTPDTPSAVVGVQTASESLPLASLPFKKHTHDQTFG